MVNYSVGDIILHDDKVNKPRLVRVTKKEENIKRGCPGFGGVEIDSKGQQIDPSHDGKMNGVWGYSVEVAARIPEKDGIPSAKAIIREIININRRRQYLPLGSVHREG